MDEPGMIAMTPCPWCGHLVPDGQEHDCRQLQISQLREEAAALRPQVEVLEQEAAARSVGFPSPRWLP